MPKSISSNVKKYLRYIFISNATCYRENWVCMRPLLPMENTNKRLLYKGNIILGRYNKRRKKKREHGED